MLPPPRQGSSSSSPPPQASLPGGLAPPPGQGQRSVSSSSSQLGWADFDDDDGWQEMPVVRSDDFTSELDAIDDARFGYRPPERLDVDAGAQSNATGVHLELEVETLATDSWREKAGIDESEYTRLRLDEDEESEEVHMRTRYLFNEDKAMTPLSQMQATKELLTEGQRIAYVGLCALIARRMLKDMGRGWEGKKIKQIKGKGRATDLPVVESANIWIIKIMARLFQHMDLDRDEQRMIDSLAEHGVDPADLVPALMTTHTVKNPEFDPAAKRRAEEEAAEQEVAEKEVAEENEKSAEADMDKKALAGEDMDDTASIAPPYEESAPPYEQIISPTSLLSPASATTRRMPSFDNDGGDIGASRPSISESDDGDIGATRLTSPNTSTQSPPPLPPKDGPVEKTENGPTEDKEDLEKTPKLGQDGFPAAVDHLSQEVAPMPALPGVSTSITNTDEDVTLDIRWTVLCDLFLVLVADSVYDARSRAFLERVANSLGFGWLDVVRFENRVTDALEIQESVGQLQQEEVITSRAKTVRRKRYAMMGAAAVGGALVIGLSAGLLAPVIGAGLGAAFTTIGITGTTGFLAGAGGAAVITTGGVLTGANIAGRGMARRTREVRTFELKPLHNNKRVSCYITVGGFMASKVDDVRLPFSVLDSIVGDVFSVLWEPEMMSEMGNALGILGTEVLTQVGQQILQATVMTALMSALQWPLILTKLGYLIDNPWINALDRAKAAGLVLADVLIQRHAGVRPTSLIGYSLGARVIFYALLELARVKAYGIVQDVYLFGATFTASRQQWLEVRSVVAGRFVNGFASNDWILGYLFRATTAGVNTVAGLRPVEAPGVENVDLTEDITGHMSYRSSMPMLLQKVGFPVTADYFDEPDDPDADPEVQERYIVLDEEEEQLKKQKKILGIFPRRKGKGSGAATPTGRGSGDGKAPKTSEDYDDDELPPREEDDPAQVDEDDLGDIGGGHAETLSPEEAAAKAEAAALKSIPKTAGFDFSAISKELGKEIDLDKLRDPNAHYRGQEHQPPPSGPSIPPVTFNEAPERTGSAPPPVPPTPPVEDARPPPPPRSQSAITSLVDEDDDDGDIAATAQRSLALDVPAWGSDNAWSASNYSSAPRVSSPLASPSFDRKPFNGFNAWSDDSRPSISQSQSGSFGPEGTRAAPPARPHPAELTNPFGDKDLENPW